MLSIFLPWCKLVNMGQRSSEGISSLRHSAVLSCGHYLTNWVNGLIKSLQTLTEFSNQCEVGWEWFSGSSVDILNFWSPKLIWAVARVAESVVSKLWQSFGISKGKACIGFQVCALTNIAITAIMNFWASNFLWPAGREQIVKFSSNLISSLTSLMGRLGCIVVRLFLKFFVFCILMIFSIKINIHVFKEMKTSVSNILWSVSIFLIMKSDILCESTTTTWNEDKMF